MTQNLNSYIQWNPVNTVTYEPKNKLAVLTCDRINEGFFLQEKCMAVLPDGQTKGRNNEVAVRRGSTVDATHYLA